jgi:hypothetical protein
MSTLKEYNELKEKIINKENIFAIVKTINNKLNINTINNQLIINFMKFIKQVDLRFLIINLKNVDNINSKIIDLYINNIKTENIDIHEIRKQTVKEQITKVLDDDSNNMTYLSYNKNLTLQSHNNHNDLQYNDIIIFLDSKYQNIANRDLALINFNISNNTKNKQLRSGSVTAVGNITNIVQFEIVSFSIPYKSIADNIQNKVTLCLREFTSDCIEAYEDSPFHFIFSTQVKKNSIILEPDNKIYKFRKPITQLNELTLRFGSPLTPIVFDKDRMTSLPVDYTKDPGILTFSQDHNLQTGDMITITNFTSNDPAADMFILNDINDPNGHPITKIDCKSISINIGFKQIRDPIPGQTVDVYFESKRIMIPLRIKYIINDST